MCKCSRDLGRLRRGIYSGKGEEEEEEEEERKKGKKNTPGEEDPVPVMRAFLFTYLYR